MNDEPSLKTFLQSKLDEVLAKIEGVEGQVEGLQGQVGGLQEQIKENRKLIEENRKQMQHGHKWGKYEQSKWARILDRLKPIDDFQYFPSILDLLGYSEEEIAQISTAAKEVHGRVGGESFSADFHATFSGKQQSLTMHKQYAARFTRIMKLLNLAERVKLESADEKGHRANFFDSFAIENTGTRLSARPDLYFYVDLHDKTRLIPPEEQDKDGENLLVVSPHPEESEQEENVQLSEMTKGKEKAEGGVTHHTETQSEPGLQEKGKQKAESREEEGEEQVILPAGGGTNKVAVISVCEVEGERTPLLSESSDKSLRSSSNKEEKGKGLQGNLRAGGKKNFGGLLKDLASLHIRGYLGKPKDPSGHHKSLCFFAIRLDQLLVVLFTPRENPNLEIQSDYWLHGDEDEVDSNYAKVLTWVLQNYQVKYAVSKVPERENKPKPGKKNKQQARRGKKRTRPSLKLRKKPNKKSKKGAALPPPSEGSSSGTSGAGPVLAEEVRETHPSELSTHETPEWFIELCAVLKYIAESLSFTMKASAEPKEEKNNPEEGDARVTSGGRNHGCVVPFRKLSETENSTVHFAIRFGIPFAYPCIIKEYNDPHRYETERRILGLLEKHKVQNVPSIMHFKEEEIRWAGVSPPLLVLDVRKGTDVRQHAMEKLKERSDRESFVVQLAEVAASTLKSVHWCGVIHRDVCPQNMVIDTWEWGRREHHCSDSACAKGKGKQCFFPFSLIDYSHSATTSDHNDAVVGRSTFHSQFVIEQERQDQASDWEALIFTLLVCLLPEKWRTIAQFCLENLEQTRGDASGSDSSPDSSFSDSYCLEDGLFQCLRWLQKDRSPEQMAKVCHKLSHLDC